jgi:hypothetical protein
MSGIELAFKIKALLKKKLINYKRYFLIDLLQENYFFQLIDLSCSLKEKSN